MKLFRRLFWTYFSCQVSPNLEFHRINKQSTVSLKTIKTKISHLKKMTFLLRPTRRHVKPSSFYGCCRLAAINFIVWRKNTTFALSPCFLLNANIYVYWKIFIVNILKKKKKIIIKILTSMIQSFHSDFIQENLYIQINELTWV